jgi:transcriptional regulator with XRE-family HTH domain
MNVVLGLRQRVGLTQELLAELSGVRRSTISRYENGHASPTLETLQRLADPASLDVVVAFEPRPSERRSPEGGPLDALGHRHSVTMSKPQDVAAEPTRLDPEDRRWLDARLTECRELLAQLRDY